MDSSDNAHSHHLRIENKNGVAVVKFDSPHSKVNILSRDLMTEVQLLIENFTGDPAVHSVVLISAKRGCFIAGADISMLGACRSADEASRLSKAGQDLLFQIEKSQKPVLAAIMGTCLGGGVEFALAAHYRIAVRDKETALGLPEVLLGLLPGAGGSQRLPRLISLPSALDMMLTGRSVRAETAREMGLVDLLVEPSERTMERLEEVAVQAARDIVQKKISLDRPRPLFERWLKMALHLNCVRNYVFGRAEKRVLALTRGLYPAPLKILEVVRTGFESGPDVGYEAESSGFASLAMTSHSRALMGLYNGQTWCKKNRFGSPDKEPERLAVFGAGVVGSGILLASIGKWPNQVVLRDVSPESVARGHDRIHKALDSAVHRKKMSPQERSDLESRLDIGTGYESFEEADVVIEAACEELEVKRRLVRQVEKHVPEHCVVACTTSILPVHRIAEASGRPDKVVGVHYTSPVDKALLLEVIAGDQTSRAAAAAAVHVGLKQGKLVIAVRDGPGFYVPRILSPLILEAVAMMQEGVGPKELDRLTRDFGFFVGVATLADELGLDIMVRDSDYLCGVFGERFGHGVHLDILREMVAAGYTGRKSGKGCFIYTTSPGVKDKEINPEGENIMKKHNTTPKHQCTTEEHQMRLATRIVNEAILCLQEGVLANPLEGDIGAVFGLGFPPLLGGPFRYADSLGADTLLNWMLKFRDIYGPRFTPCQLLVDHARDPGRKFHSTR